MTEVVWRCLGWAGMAALAIVFALGLVGAFVEPQVLRAMDDDEPEKE